MPCEDRRPSNFSVRRVRLATLSTPSSSASTARHPPSSVPASVTYRNMPEPPPSPARNPHTAAQGPQPCVFKLPGPPKCAQLCPASRKDLLGQSGNRPHIEHSQTIECNGSYLRSGHRCHHGFWR